MEGPSDNTARRVCSEHRSLLFAVLARTGPWSIQESRDLIEEFAEEDLARALATFDPRRPIEPWLAVVFRNFALRWKRRRERHRQALTFVADSLFATSSELVEENPDPRTPRAVLEEVARLPAPQAECVRLFFGRRDGGASVNAVAKAAGLSWHKARKSLFAGIRAVTSGLADRGLLARTDLAVVRRAFDESSPGTVGVATALGVDPEEVNERLLRVLRCLAALRS